jgi:two-component system, LytTR family, response regulator AlgR
MTSIGSALTAMVVDDEQLARARMRTLLAQCAEPACALVAEAGDAMEAMSQLRSISCDVVLLDIHMPGADGLQLARELRKIKPDLSIVFVTAHPEHAVEAFDLDVMDYLTKPVRLDRLQKALLKVQQKSAHVLSSQEHDNVVLSGLKPELASKFLVIQDRGRTERVPLGEVLYFKAELKYVTVRTAERSFILDGSLTELEAQYGESFLRIHRNTLVARHQMRAVERYTGPADEEGEGIEGWAVRLRDCEEALLISRRQLAAVRDAIAKG